MLTAFSVRNKWIIMSVVAGVFLAAFFWTGLGQEDTPRLQDQEVRNYRNGSPEKDSIRAFSARVHHASKSGDVGTAEQALSCPPPAGFGTPEFSFGTSQWPHQSAGAYCSLQISKGTTSTFAGMVENGLLTRFTTCRTRVGSYNYGVHEITESREMSSAGQFRWNGFHQPSPNSQGSVLVNF